MTSSRRTDRPQAVTTAVGLLWASVGLSALKTIIDFDYVRSIVTGAFATAVLVLTVAVLVLLIVMISAGRNWARIALLILFVVGMLPTVPFLYVEFTRAPIVGALSVLQLAVQVGALTLLFARPSRAWFRR